MLNAENIEKIEILFKLHEQEQNRQKFNSLCSTLKAKRKNADYCYEYLKRYNQKSDVQMAIYFTAKEYKWLIG